MKLLTSALLVSLLAFISCKKDTDTQTNNPIQSGITYPDSLYFGKNILSYPDSAVLVDGTDYEIGAVLPGNASLSVVITNYPVIDSASGHSTMWFHWNENGWTVGDYNDTTNTQIYTSSQTGKIGGQILFAAMGLTGKCKVDFYENGNAITRTKYFSWH